MPRTLFTNVSVFDGSGQSSFPGEVLVQGNRIRTVAKGNDQIDSSLAEEVVDGGGATLMPGLTEAHGHLSYTNQRSRTSATCQLKSTCSSRRTMRS